MAAHSWKEGSQKASPLATGLVGEGSVLGQRPGQPGGSQVSGDLWPSYSSSAGISIRFSTLRLFRIPPGPLAALG